MSEHKHPIEILPAAPIPVSDTADFHELVDVIRKLSNDLHALKGGISANTSFTLATLEKQDQQHTRLTALEDKLSTVSAQNSEMTTLFEAGKKGVGFFQGLGRVLYRLASWLRPILIAGTMTWAILHGKWPTGGE